MLESMAFDMQCWDSKEERGGVKGVTTHLHKAPAKNYEYYKKHLGSN